MVCIHAVAFVTDADRRLEQTVKERLDAIAFPLHFFREYDEPNEVFAPRLVCAIPALGPLVARLPIWPNVSVPRGNGGEV